MVILRSAGPYTRISHLLRAISPSLWPTNLLRQLDEYTLREVERLLATPLPKRAQEQSLLPLSFGGLGLPSASDREKHPHFHYKALLSIREKLQLLNGFDNLQTTINVIPPHNQQNNAKDRFELLSRSISPAQRVLLYQIKNLHSGAVLTAKPTGNTEINDEAFTTPIRLRLGLEQLLAGFNCETHGAAIDTHAYHALSCQNFQGAVHARHDLIRDELFALCQTLDRDSEVKQSSMHSITEQLSLNDPQTEQRASGRTIPGDITVRLTRDAEARTFYDITVINTLTGQAVATALQRPDPESGTLAVLEEAYHKKLSKHAAEVTRIGGQFYPLVLSVTGVWHPDWLRRLRELSGYAAARRGRTETEGWKTLLARIGCALARGNALILKAARSAMHPETADDQSFDTGGTLPDRFVETN